MVLLRQIAGNMLIVYSAAPRRNDSGAKQFVSPVLQPGTAALTAFNTSSRSDPAVDPTALVFLKL